MIPESQTQRSAIPQCSSVAVITGGGAAKIPVAEGHGNQIVEKDPEEAGEPVDCKAAEYKAQHNVSFSLEIVSFELLEVVKTAPLRQSNVATAYKKSYEEDLGDYVSQNYTY